MKKIYLLTSLFLSATTTTLPMQLVKKINDSVSNFIQKSLDTYTYDFKSPEHRKFLVFTFILPERIGQYYLYRQRQNMKKFLEQNEKNALEGLKKHHNIDDELWNKAVEQHQKNYALHLQALKDNSSTSKAIHDKNIPAEWIPLFESASKKLDINYKNINIIIDDTINTTGSSRNNILSKSNSIPATITLNKSNLESILNHWKQLNVDVISQVIEHEFTHTKKGHSLFISTLSDTLEQETPQIPQTPNFLYCLIPGYNTYITNKYVTETEEYANKKNIHIKQQRQLINLIESIGVSLTGRIYFESYEKTADTLLACDYPDNAHNGRRGTSYEFNYNDIFVLYDNWRMVKEIQQSREAARNIQKRLSNVMPRLRLNPSPFKKSSTFTTSTTE